ncbi:MAG: hypothetical protein DMD91_34045 [Candidatus Rokuibacteriota bacterium]|nr:MAG: hypothetical protein DMD91_34045 [Candidatus Rokubacteria bacterium]
MHRPSFLAGLIIMNLRRRPRLAMGAGAAFALILLSVILWLALRHESRATAGLTLAVLAIVVVDLAVSGLIVWAFKPEPVLEDGR